MIFTYRFSQDDQRNDRLICRIKVSGRFITLYVPEEKKDIFLKERKPYLKGIVEQGIKVLSIGEGQIHDMAHAGNKSLSFLNGHKTAHWHFICPKEVDVRTLQTLLSVIKEPDLTEKEKNEIIVNFNDRLANPTLKDIVDQIANYRRLLADFLGDEECNDRLVMPKVIFKNILKKISDKLPKDFNNTSQIDPNLCITFQSPNIRVNLKKFMEGFEKAMKFGGKLVDIQEALQGFFDKKMSQGELINKLKDILSDIQRSGIVDLEDMLPVDAIQEELRSNIPSSSMYRFYQSMLAVFAKRFDDNSFLEFLPKQVDAGAYSSIAISSRGGSLALFTSTSLLSDEDAGPATTTTATRLPRTTPRQRGCIVS